MPNPACSVLRCPRCNGELHEVDNALFCPSCAAQYERREGIWDFRCGRYDYYLNPIPRDAMREIVRRAPSVPWDDTIREFLNFVPNKVSWIDNIVVNSRYSWKLFLNLQPTSRVLDLGCGLGNLTQNIAPHVGEIVALDLTWDRLRFAQQRFAHLKQNEHITPIAGGDGRYLPFRDQHFDVITLSGVLEWVADDDEHAFAGLRTTKLLKMIASIFGQTNPRRVQLRLLKELRRVLKPDGQLFVAIENRWSYEYFRTRPDHHSGLMYGSLLPRHIANLYSIIRRHVPYRTYTYGARGLARLLRAAGFPRQEYLGLTPGYSNLQEIVPFTAGAWSRYWHTRAYRGLKERITRSRYFVPAFGIVGSVATAVPMIGRLLDEIADRNPALRNIQFHSCIITGKEKVVLSGRLGPENVVLKLPTDPRSQRGEENNQRLLKILSSKSMLADSVPKPLTHGEFQGIPYFLESTLTGMPLREEMGRMNREAIAKAIGAVLIRINTSSRGISISKADDDIYTSLLEQPSERLLAARVDPARCLDFKQHLRGALAEHEWSVGLCHGDFSVSNIFVSSNDISGVIDWEYAMPQGIPVLDAIGYMESMQRLVQPESTFGENIGRLSRWDWPSAQEIAMLHQLYEHFGVAESAHRILCSLYWLQHVSRQLDTTARFDSSYLDRNVNPLLLSVIEYSANRRAALPLD